MKSAIVSIGTLLLLLGSFSSAQNVPGSRKDDIVIGSNGTAVPTPTVWVCLNNATGIPCTPLAQIFSDGALTQPLSNPITGDAIGNYFIYAAPGRYLIQISGFGIAGTQIFPDVIIPNDPVNPIFNIVGIRAQSAKPGTPPSGVGLLYPKNDGNLYFQNSAGVEVCVTCGGGGGGGGTVTSVGLVGPGGIFSVSNSPVVTFGNIALSTNGTSGGIPYFSNGLTLSSSGILTQNSLIKGGGTGASPIPSSVIDDGINPVQSPNGITLIRGGLYKQLPNAGSGTTVNLAVCENSAGQATTCAASVTSGVSGTAGQGAGTTGNVQVCIVGRCSVLFDNTTIILHWAIPSTTVAGEFHDTGSTAQTPGVQNFLIDSVNGGTGTAAFVNLASPDAIGTGFPGVGGSGTANSLAKFIGSSSIGNSLWTDNGTISQYLGTGGISTTLATFGGTGPFSINGQEGSPGSCPSITSGFDILCWNGTAHALYLSNNGNVYLQIAQLPIASANLTIQNTYRTCMIDVGADNAAAVLVNADLGPQGRQCFVPFAATVVEVTVAGDAGTPSVLTAKNHAGTRTDILTTPLATAASGGLACANAGGTVGLDGATTCSATLSTTSILGGDWLELDTGGIAGGTAKRMSVSITYVVN